MVRLRKRARQTFSLADETALKLMEVAAEVESKLKFRFHAGMVIDVACKDLTADAVIAALGHNGQQSTQEQPTHA